MQHRYLLIAALALTATLRGDMQENASMLYAHQASAMLGPTLWKRVLHIHNSSGDGHYPRSFGAVVFEMGGILWFYTPNDGTQSLSLRRGHVVEDERDLGRLLTQIDPGFSRWEYDSEGNGKEERGLVPPNACFIQSVELLRERLLFGMSTQNAKLLSYYVTYPTGLKGHTVLYVETDRGPTIIDPLKQRRPLIVRDADAGDPKCVALCIRRDVALARWVPIGSDDFAANRAEGVDLASNQNGETKSHSGTPFEQPL